MNTLELKKSLLSTPGDSIQEHIDFISMSQAELAERLGRSIPKLNELIKGKAPITKETAAKLEYVLGIDASFWINKEKYYQEELLAIEQLEFLETCKSWLKGFPVAALKKMNLLPDTNVKSEIARALLKFFRVASPNEWSTIYEGESLAFKIELKHTTDPKAISAWLRIGELQANQIELKKFDKKNLTDALSTIQEIAFNESSSWKEDLQKVCATFGVALVYSPCLSKAPIYGAARWIKNKSVPLIQLTDRKKDYNAFWFSFYHELAHIRYHNKSDIFIDGIDNIQPDNTKEKEADDFAAKMVFSESLKQKALDRNLNTVENLKSFSIENKVHLSILISQLQRLDKINYNDFTAISLKSKVEFDELVFQ
jgi:plasmid maintenance system antidote protein VapI/Zn-dependent peptidase ImmA (M78 family)